VAFAAGLVAGAVALLFTSWQVSMLLGWITSSSVYLVWIWRRIWPLDGEGTFARATREDDSRVSADAILVAACVASLVAVAIGLVKAVQVGGLARGLIASIAVLTVALSWMVVHTVFLLRYARQFHVEGGGIEFHEEGDRKPDYHDFAYIAFTIGMTYQVSDTDIKSSQIRRIALRHSLISFMFGIVIVAITINVLAGLFR
jgi:uncharacterized membrane protein